MRIFVLASFAALAAWGYGIAENPLIVAAPRLLSRLPCNRMV
jgi:hypothetical protein